MSVTTLPQKAAVGNLMSLVGPGDGEAIDAVIALVDRLMIGMLQHRPHDRTVCKVWTDEGYTYLTATGATLRHIRDSHSRFLVSPLVIADHDHEADYR